MYKNKICHNLIYKIIAFPFGVIGDLIYLPLLDLYMKMFLCTKENGENVLKFIREIKCKSLTHIIHFFISCLAILLYSFYISIYKYAFTDIRKNHKNFTNKKHNVPDLYFILYRFILVLINNIDSEDCNILILIFLFIFISFVSFHFLIIMPFRNNIFNTLYCFMTVSLTYTQLLLILLYFLKDKSFDGGIFLFFFGIIFLIIFLIIYDINEVSFNIIFIFGEFDSLIIRRKLNYICSFLERPKLDRRQEIFLRTYTLDCLYYNKNESIKKFFDSNCLNKVYLIEHIDYLFKYYIKKFPTDVRIRLNYIQFLYFKMKKIQKSQMELENLQKICIISINEEFCIFQLKKILNNSITYINNNNNDIENDNNYYNNESFDIYNELKFLNSKNIFIENLKNIVNNYIMFWNILLNSHKDIVHDLVKLSNIGKKISDLNENITKSFKNLLEMNKIEKKLLKIYTLFQQDILNNIEFNYDKNLVNDEISNKSENIFENDKNGERIVNIEQEKYIIVISGKNEIFGNIIQISLNACALLGYTLEEILGKNINILIPEIFHEPHNNILRNRIKEINNDLNFISLDLKFKEINYFILNKSQYLIPFHGKVYIITNEIGEYSFVVNFTYLETGYNDINYILTNSLLYIKNFSINCIKNLGLNNDYVLSNYDIINNIKEYHDEYINYLLENENEENNNKEKNYYNFNTNSLHNLNNKNNSYRNKNHNIKIKIKILNENIYKSKIITWKKGKNIYSGYIKKNYSSYNFQNNYNSLFNTNNIYNHKKSFMSNTILLELTIQQIVMNNKIYGFVFKFKKDDYTSTSVEKEDSNLSTSKIMKLGNKYFKRKRNNKNEKTGNSIISISENDNNVIDINSTKNLYIYREKSLNEKMIGKDYLPNIDKEFIININKGISFIQKEPGSVNEQRKIVKNLAIKKIQENNTNINNNNDSSNLSDDEESESYISSSDSSFTSQNDEEEEEEDENNNKSNNNENINNISNIFVNILNDNNENNKKNERNNRKKKSTKRAIKDNIIELKKYFYNVNFKNIIFSIYNYKKKIPIENKNHIYKFQSQVEITLNEDDNENLKFLHNIIPENKKKKETKRKNISIKKQDNINIEINEKETFKLKRQTFLKKISLALNKKDSLKSVFIVSLLGYFIILVLLVEAILYIIFLKNYVDKIVIFNNILRCSNNYLIRLTNVIFDVRELTLLANDSYNYILFQNRTYSIEYFLNDLLEQYTYMQYDQKNIIIYSYMYSKNGYKNLFNKTYMVYFLDTFTNNRIGLEMIKSSAISYLESAIFRIHQTKLMSSIYPLEKNVFFVQFNAFNSLFVASEEQSNIITDEMMRYMRNVKFFCCIIYGCYFIIDVILYILFLLSYYKVVKKKDSYIIIFFEINANLINELLQKCESFMNKINKNYQNKNNHNNKEQSIESSNFKENKIYNYNNNNNINVNNSEEEINLNNEEKAIKKKKKFKFSDFFTEIIWIIIFIHIIIPTTISTNYTFKIYDNYKFTNKVISNVLNIEVSLLMDLNLMKEFIFDQERTYKINYNLSEYFPQLMLDIYKNLSELTTNLENNIISYSSLLPIYHQIVRGNLCNYSDEYIALYNEYNNSILKNITCSSISGDSIPNGLYQVLFFYIETIRYMYTVYRGTRYLQIKYNFHYNLTLLGTELQNSLVPNHPILSRIYYISHPFYIFNNKENIQINFIFKFILVPVFYNLFNNIRSISYTKTYMLYIFVIPSAVFMFVMIFVYIIFWKRFELKLDETIFKTKKMLTIIPIETLMKVKHIKELLNIENDNELIDNETIIWKPINFERNNSED